MSKRSDLEFTVKVGMKPVLGIEKDSKRSLFSFSLAFSRVRWSTLSRNVLYWLHVRVSSVRGFVRYVFSETFIE